MNPITPLLFPKRNQNIDLYYKLIGKMSTDNTQFYKKLTEFYMALFGLLGKKRSGLNFSKTKKRKRNPHKNRRKSRR